MATAKFTVQRGKVQLKDVALSAGSAEAQTDTISLNIDYTNAKRSEVLLMLQAIEQRIIQGKYPFQ
jgi:hypothetical protein